MTIVIIPKGTAQIKTGYLSAPLSGLTINNVLIAAVAADTIPSLSLYGITPFIGSPNVAANNSGNVFVSINHYLITATSASVAWGTSSDGVAKTISFYEISGLQVSSSPADASSVATGSSGSPSSGATTDLGRADELVIGAIGVEDNVEDIAGSWTTGAGNVSGNEQQTGTTGGGGASNIVIRTAAEVVSATTAQTAAITSMASADWAAAVATFKQAASLVVPTSARLNYIRM